MKALLFTILLAGAVWGLLPGQNPQLDPAERRRLAALASDLHRVDTLNEWAFQRDGAASLPYARAALQLAKSSDYAYGYADALLRLGQAAAYDGDFFEAERYYRRSLELRKGLNDLPGVAGCYNQLGLLCKKRGDYQGALALYQRGLARFEGQAAHVTAAVLHNNAGTAYRYLGHYADAIREFGQCLAVYAQLRQLPGANRPDISTGMASLRMNIALLLQDNLAQYGAAHDSLQKSLLDFETWQRPKYAAKCLLALGNNAYYRGNAAGAMQYYDRALLLKDAMSADDQAIIQKNRGRIFLQQHDYGKAQNTLQTALDTFLRTDNLREIAATYYEMGNLHYENQALGQATELYQKALAYEPKDPILKSHLLYFLTNALDEEGRHEEASNYSTQYVALLGQLDSTQTQTAFEKTIQYQLDKNRLEKQLVKHEAQTRQLYAWAGFGVLATLLLVAALVALLYRQKNLLAEQRTQLLTREKLELVQSLELQTYSAWLEGQEETQQKIGKELHDGLGSLLSTVKLHFASVENRLDELQTESRSQYETANRLLDHACQEVRRISHELASALLMKFGLKAQLEALADAIGSSGKMAVELSVYGLGERLDSKLEINVYRMIQILTHNVLEHSKAKKITISVNYFNDLLNIMVEDNGQGFRQEDLRLKSGIGMKNLAARVHDLDGVLHIDSRPGQGTRISIDLPIVGEHARTLALNN